MTLLDLGCSITDLDLNNESPMFYAVRANRLENVKLILAQPSFSTLMIKAKNVNNEAILHAICIPNRSEILKEVLEFIVRKFGQKELTKLLNFKSNNSKTCMHECVINGS
jgi:ankyrin repeat protein